MSYIVVKSNLGGMTVKSFAYGLNFYKLFWVFFLSCIIGVAVETVWCFYKNHRFESRKGLIYGPFNLVYGFGGVWMTLALWPIEEYHSIIIFAVGCVIGGVWEYLCSLFQEKVFGSVSWDYKKFPLNLNGRISLAYCFFWGLLAVWWVRSVYPFFSKYIEMIPNTLGIVLTWIFFAFIIYDSVASAAVVYRMRERTEGKAAKNKFWQYVDRRFPDERVRKIYPNMVFAADGQDDGESVKL